MKPAKRPNWFVRLDAKAGGRCYLSRNAYLVKWLTATGRFRPDEPTDIVYTQVGYGAFPNLGQRVNAVQSVTYVSDRVASIESVAAAELKATVAGCVGADLVLVHSDVHRRSLLSVGVSDVGGRIKVVRPAPAVSVSRCSGGPRKRVVRYAGQDLPRKRKNWAVAAAQNAGVPLYSTNTTRFGSMGAWYDGIALVAVPSMGESWSMVVSEAIAHGVPVVCTYWVGASEEVIETGAGLVCASEDPREFISAVSFVLANNERFAELARAAPVRRLSEWARDLVSTVEAKL